MHSWREWIAPHRFVHNAIEWIHRLCCKKNAVNEAEWKTFSNDERKLSIKKYTEIRRIDFHFFEPKPKDLQVIQNIGRLCPWAHSKPEPLNESTNISTKYTNCDCL